MVEDVRVGQDSNLADALKEEFGGVVLAMPVDGDFAFYAIVDRVTTNDDGKTDTVRMWGDPQKNYQFKVLSVETQPNQWALDTDQGRWLFRTALSSDQGSKFKQDMARVKVTPIG
jgi:hypothetical protein